MDNAYNKLMTRREKVNYILDGASKYFSIPRGSLKQGGGARSPAWQKKKYIMVLLCDYTPCTLREVANELGYKSHANVIYNYKKLKEELSGNLYGCDKTKMIYRELLTFLNLNGNENKDYMQAKKTA